MVAAGPGPGSIPSETAILIENGGRFFFLQPDLGVIGSGQTISAAYDTFAASRSKYLTEAAAAGVSAETLAAARGGSVGLALSGQGRPAAGVSKDDFAQSLKIFAAKLCIVLLIVGVLAAAAGSIVGGAIARVTASLDAIQPLSIADIDTKVADVVRDFRSLAPERKEALKRNIAAMARELQPLSEAWHNPPADTGESGATPNAAGKN